MGKVLNYVAVPSLVIMSGLAYFGYKEKARELTNLQIGYSISENNYDRLNERYKKEANKHNEDEKRLVDAQKQLVVYKKELEEEKRRNIDKERERTAKRNEELVFENSILKNSLGLERYLEENRKREKEGERIYPNYDDCLIDLRSAVNYESFSGFEKAEFNSIIFGYKPEEIRTMWQVYMQPKEFLDDLRNNELTLDIVRFDSRDLTYFEKDFIKEKYPWIDLSKRSLNLSERIIVGFHKHYIGKEMNKEVGKENE